MQLKFNNNGKFKILLLADAQDTDKPQKETIGIIENMLRISKPDLVVLLGDNIEGQYPFVTPQRTAKAIEKTASVIAKYGVPFALVFGNHDHEGLCNKENRMTERQAKEFILNEYRKYGMCLAVPGEEMTGYCNYNLTISSSKSDKPAFNLWFIDSNPYAKEGGYGYIQPDQTDWYIKRSNELKRENNGNPLPSILFQHIPVPEVYEFTDISSPLKKGAFHGNTKLFHGKYYVTNDKAIQGRFHEGACPADVLHNQFTTWKNQGDIIGAFFGHDHPNDYLGFLDGIGLCAVPACGYNSYGWNHGARTIILDESDLSKFETELFHEKEILGKKVYPIYKRHHGYKQYKKKFLPTIGAISAISATALTVTTSIIIKARKTK